MYSQWSECTGRGPVRVIISGCSLHIHCVIVTVSTSTKTHCNYIAFSVLQMLEVQCVFSAADVGSTVRSTSCAHLILQCVVETAEGGKYSAFKPKFQCVLQCVQSHANYSALKRCIRRKLSYWGMREKELRDEIRAEFCTLQTNESLWSKRSLRFCNVERWVADESKKGI